MEKYNVQRLVMKENDILVIKVPETYLRHGAAITRLYEKIKKTLLPRKNKILILPVKMELSVIGEEEIKEYISKIDLWQLWDLNKEEN